MARLIAQRLFFGLVTLWAASAPIFAGAEALPGDLASAILQNNATPEALAALRAELCLERPALLRYWEWLAGARQGDFGRSLANKRDVAADFMPPLRNTLFLAAYAAAVAVPLSVALGLMSTIWRGRALDRSVNVVTLMTISAPEYFLVYILVKYLAVQAGWFPSLANVIAAMPPQTRLYVTFLPMLTLVLPIAAHIMRMTRASVLAMMASPYIETAILKGTTKWRLVIGHAPPNALAPIIYVVALNLAYLVVGVVVVEAALVYPGLGQLMVDAVAKKDVPVVKACGLIFAVAFILLNLAADILGIVSNPRLRRPR